MAVSGRGGRGRIGVAVSADWVTVAVSQRGVCVRTAEVRDAIVAAISGVSACADVTPTHLGAITTLDVSDKSLGALEGGGISRGSRR